MKTVARYLGPMLMWFCGWFGHSLYVAHGHWWIAFVSGAICGVVGGVMGIILDDHRSTRGG
jgi:glycerol uptake facilitator-like aquaporin